MNFKEEVKQILRRRKEHILSVTKKSRISLEERLLNLQERKRIQNILDLLD